MNGMKSAVAMALLLLLAADSGRADCWDTGCQPDSWLVKGCEQYGMKETKRQPCEGSGYIYSCCHQGNSANPSGQPATTSNAIHAGDVTYYSLGLTACGKWYTDSDMVAAVAFGHFTTPNPNVDPMCGKRATVVDPTTLKSVVVKIVDKCEACKMDNIDVSPTAFEMLRPKSVGRFKVKWHLS